MPSVVPCRIPIWLAGVVAGSVGVHSMNSWLPPRIHRDNVGRVPPMIPHCSTGKGTPSSCTNSMPVTSGSGTGSPRRAPRTRRAKTASLVPAVISHEASVATPATIHDAHKAARNESSCTPGTTERAKYARAA